MISSLGALLGSAQLASASWSCSWVYDRSAEHSVSLSGPLFHLHILLELPFLFDLAVAAGASRHRRLIYANHYVSPFELQ